MRIAVIGATGVVGAEIVRVLQERRIAVDELLLFASRDRDEPVRFAGRDIPVRAGLPEAIVASAPDVAFFASSDDASATTAQALAAAGTVVIDNSSTFRLAPDVPLVIPEVNPHAIRNDHRIFPVANCTAIVLCCALAPIERGIGLAEVRVATYQAVSGAGRAGLERLDAEEAADANGEPLAHDGPFVAAILRNVVPVVGAYDGSGDTGEEAKVIAETRKMLDRPDLHVAATTVRVPVRRAHSEAVFFRTSRPSDVEEIAALLTAAPGLVYHERGAVTPRDVEDTDLVHVARLRAEPGRSDDFQMWVVGDQLRKGAATNGVQILELLLAQGRFAKVRA